MVTERKLQGLMHLLFLPAAHTEEVKDAEEKDAEASEEETGVKEVAE